MSFVVIETSFGCIREYRDSDAASLVKYANNRKIWLNMRDRFPHPYRDEDAFAFLKLVKAQQPTTFFAIANDAEVIGGIGIMINQDVHRLTAELGYWLGEPFWGKGFVTESVQKFSDYAFDKYGLIRIYAEAYADNKASARVLEKAGFVFEGTMKANVIKDGRILDQRLYAKVRQLPAKQQEQTDC